MTAPLKYGIMACIHANLLALQAVLRDAEGNGCDHLACCGDIVGYGVQPKECLDLVRSLNIPCVKGNHDEYASTDSALEGFNPKAASNVQWTRDQLGSEDKKWLRNLKLVQEIAGFTITHGTLNEPDRWGYVFDKLAAQASLEWQKTNVCFFGHTHVPVAFIRDSVVRGGTFSKMTVESGRQYFVNVGSVGQPRDGNPKAAYVIYDLAESSIALRRVEFERGTGGPPAEPTPLLVQ